MANVKNITKKLVSAGYSENKLMMMTEKEIREAYKTLKEESTMIKVVCKNRMDSKGNTSTSTKEYNSLEEAMKAAKDIAEAASVISVTIVGKDKIIVKEESTMNVADENIVVENNINESINESPATVVFDDVLALKILEGVIRQADTNKVHNFISDWMLTSIISELIIGLPLKDKGIEHYKTFTDDQKKNISKIRKAFVKRAKLVAKYNSSKITGYYIPSKVLIWGRHKYLGVACVYRFMHGSKVAAEYHVSLNGIKNTATNKITALDDAAYETLDTKCVFII